jgi:hypothetical protein
LLKDQVEKLKVENLAFQEKYDMLLCSHENLMDDHIMLNIAHEVVIENLKSQQPHSCTCNQIETILPCANACCSSTSKSSFELKFLGTKHDTCQELKEENERLKMSLTQLKGKCTAQPSQDNHDYMVKKLETGSTVACTKALEENVKDLRIAKRKEQKKKIKTSARSLNRASMQGNIQASKKQGKKKSSRLEDRLCYICRKKGHQCKDCPIGNYPTSSLSIISHVTRQPKIATCARKVMSLPSANTKDFWVPRSWLTNLDGPIKRWVPKYA